MIMSEFDVKWILNFNSEKAKVAVFGRSSIDWKNAF